MLGLQWLVHEGMCDGRDAHMIYTTAKRGNSKLCLEKWIGVEGDSKHGLAVCAPVMAIGASIFFIH